MHTTTEREERIPVCTETQKGEKTRPKEKKRRSDGGTVGNELTNEHTLEKDRTLRREAPQGVGEGDVTEADEAGRDKSCLTLLEPLLFRETATHNMCQALL